MWKQEQGRKNSMNMCGGRTEESNQTKRNDSERKMKKKIMNKKKFNKTETKSVLKVTEYGWINICTIIIHWSIYSKCCFLCTAVLDMCSVLSEWVNEWMMYALNLTWTQWLGCRSMPCLSVVCLVRYGTLFRSIPFSSILFCSVQFSSALYVGIMLCVLNAIKNDSRIEMRKIEGCWYERSCLLFRWNMRNVFVYSIG